MAGEYQLAKRLIDQGLEEVAASGGMDGETFARALLYELIQHDLKTRGAKNVKSELEQCLIEIDDGGDHVITRGS